MPPIGPFTSRGGTRIRLLVDALALVVALGLAYGALDDLFGLSGGRARSLGPEGGLHLSPDVPTLTAMGTTLGAVVAFGATVVLLEARWRGGSCGSATQACRAGGLAFALVSWIWSMGHALTHIPIGMH